MKQKQQQQHRYEVGRRRSSNRGRDWWAGQEDEKWSGKSFRKLALLYKRATTLWKKDAPSYLDSSRRYQAYAQIHKALAVPDVTFLEVMMKIREMRRIYVRELKRIFEAQAAGRYYETEFSCFHDLNDFLFPYLDYDETTELRSIKQLGTDKSDVWPENSQDGILDRCSTEYSTANVNISKNFINKFTTFEEAHDGITSPINIPLVKLQKCNTACQTVEKLDLSQSKFSSTMRGSVYSRPSPMQPVINDSCSSTIVCDNPCPCWISVSELENQRRTKHFANNTISEMELQAAAQSVIAEYGNGSDDFISTGLKIYDQFDIFANSIARQLRKMNFITAIKAKAVIQQILTNIRTSAAVASKSSETVYALGRGIKIRRASRRTDSRSGDGIPSWKHHEKSRRNASAGRSRIRPNRGPSLEVREV